MAKLSAAKKDKINKTKGSLGKVAKVFAPKKIASTHKALRKSIVPGTVVIALAGAYKGKRVVFVKRLDNGKLLCTGVIKVNGTPLFQIEQNLVIATSSKLDLSDDVVKAVEGVDAKFFAKIEQGKKSKEFFNAETRKTVNPLRVDTQKAVDAALLPVVKAAGMQKYIASIFTVGHHDRVHEMKF